MNERTVDHPTLPLPPPPCRSRFLDRLSPEELHRLATLQLRLVGEGDPMAQDAGFLREVMLSHFERRKFRRETINELPLYPTEGVLGDPAKLPSVHYSGEGGGICMGLCSLVGSLLYNVMLQLMSMAIYGENI